MSADPSYEGLQVPLIVETTTTYVVWVFDDDASGAVALAQLHQDNFDPDLLRHQAPVDGDVTVRAFDEWDRSLIPAEPHGPWPRCAYPECERTLVYYYGQRRCFEHHDREEAAA